MARTPRNQFSADPQTEKTLHHSIKDGAYFAMMTGGAEGYFSAFAVFLQASTLMIGLISSLPPLLASSMQVFSAWLGRKTGRRKQIIVFGALFQAWWLIPLALLPVIAPAHSALLILPVIFLYLCGPNLGAPQWNSLVGDLLPESRRGRFFAYRTRYSSIASLAALMVAGILLDRFDEANETYWGFLIIFLLGAAARLMSAYHLNAMIEPSDHVASLEIPDDLSLWRRIRHSSLLKFSMFFACMQLAVAISGPYFTLYLLRDLGLSYLQFMVITVASVAVQFLTLNRWGRLSDLFGNRLILVTTGSIITVIPVLWLFSTSFYWLLVVQTLSGLIWAGFTLSATAFVFDLTPPDQRATLFAAHNVLAAIAVFFGASIGAIAAAYVPSELTILDTSFEVFTPLYGLFLFSCLTRICVAAVFLPLLKEVRRVRPMSMGGLIFRVTRMHPISGLIFDVVGRKRGKSNDANTHDADLD